MTALIAISDGLTLRPAGRPNAAVLAKVPKGRPVKIEIEQPRNPRRHAMFFAVITEAFKNWPEGHEFQPESTEHLRAWLLCKAGWSDTLDLDLPTSGSKSGNGTHAIDKLMKVLVAFTGSKHVFTKPLSAQRIRAYRPKSQSFAKCKESEIKPIIDRVYDIIAIESGMQVADLKRSAETA